MIEETPGRFKNSEGKDIFSVRFSAFLYNSEEPDIDKEMLRVLSYDEARSLPELRTHTEKLAFAARKPGLVDICFHLFFGSGFPVWRFPVVWFRLPV